MFIVPQKPGDTLVLDSVQGHRRTYERLAAFLTEPQATIELQAASNCPLLPGRSCLGAFRMVKTEGLVYTEHLPAGVLQVSGRPELLARYIESFVFQPGMGSSHHHPEQKFLGELAPGSDMVIVEAEDELDDESDAPVA